jgi:hypothetical protein
MDEMCLRFIRAAMEPGMPAGVPLLGRGFLVVPKGRCFVVRAHAHAPSLSLLVMAHRHPLLLTTTTTTRRTLPALQNQK